MKTHAARHQYQLKSTDYLYIHSFTTVRNDPMMETKPRRAEATTLQEEYIVRPWHDFEERAFISRRQS